MSDVVVTVVQPVTSVSTSSSVVAVSSTTTSATVTTQTAGPQGATGPQGVAGKFTTGDTAPVSPGAGDGWYDSSTGFTYVYYNDGTSSQWVQVGNANAGPTGATGASGVVSVTSPITNTGTSTSAVLGVDSTVLRTTGDQTKTGLFTVTPSAVGSKGLVVQGLSGQTANLTEWQDSTGTMKSAVLSNGDWVVTSLYNTYMGVGTGYSDFQGAATALYVRPTQTTRVGATVKGLASQTANLQEWQNSAGSALARVSSNGQIATAANLAVGSTSIVSTNQAQVTVTSATNIGMVIQGAASQSGEYLKILDSASSTLVKITSAGNLQSVNLMSLNSLFIAGEENSGAKITMTRQTTAPAVPGTNIGKLYFKAGTTGLALYAMGPTGTEVRIADNIT